MDYNPRYVAYARSHGHTPDAMLETDNREWPGGCMTGFMLWLGARWTDFEKLKAAKVRSYERSYWRVIHETEFDLWLNAESL